MKALIGKKIGMTRVFGEDGKQMPVTVIEAGPCVVVQRKTADKDGYDAVQLGFGNQKPQRVKKPLGGHFRKAGVGAGRVLGEVPVEAGAELEPGAELGVSIFEDVAYVDVSARSKGRGFQGVMKRYDFGGGRATHGSHSKRRPGSVGQCEIPARIFKNKKMPGQTGNVKASTQNLKVVSVRPDDNVILVAGSVPGPGGGIVTIRQAIKKA